MSDREYVKINTSIQTGSNAQNLIEDGEGNVQAEIELRLPDNLFSASSGAKKVDKVELLTTKMRVSMQNTPIAQIPIDTELQTPTFTPSTCQLDVYPFCLIDDEEFFPKTIEATAFPNYRTPIKITLIYMEPNPAPNPDVFLIHTRNFSLPADAKEPSEVINEMLGEPAIEAVGKSIIALTQKCLKSLRTDEQSFFAPRMNMALSSNHERENIENGELLINKISSLSQLWNDALENAMIAALRDMDRPIVFFIPVVQVAWLNNVSEEMAEWTKTVLELDTTNTYLLPLDPLEEVVPRATPCYVGANQANDLYTSARKIWVPLRTAFKPEVSFDNNSLSISYDTAPFHKNTPIIWNPSLVETGNTPEQLRDNPFLSAYTLEPPAKRYYIAPVTEYGESWDERSIDTNLIYTGIDSRAFNIIGNRATRDTFSFLPWTEIPANKAPVRPHLALANGEPFYLLNAGGTKTERSTYDMCLDGDGTQKIITERAHVQQRMRFVYNKAITSGDDNGLAVRMSYVDQGFTFPMLISHLVWEHILTDEEGLRFSEMFLARWGANRPIGSYVGYVFKLPPPTLDFTDMSFSMNDVTSVKWSGLSAPNNTHNVQFDDVFIIPEQGYVPSTPYPFEAAPKFEFVEETTEAGSGTPPYPYINFETNVESEGRYTYSSNGEVSGDGPSPEEMTGFGGMWTNSRTYQSYDWEGDERPSSEEFQWHTAVVFHTLNPPPDILVPDFTYRTGGRVIASNFNCYFILEGAIPSTDDLTILCVQDIGQNSIGSIYGEGTIVVGKRNSTEELSRAGSIIALSQDQRYTPIALDRVDNISLTRRRVSGYSDVTRRSIKITTQWNNLPIVVMSPIQSFVLTLQGVQVRQEYQPINRVEGNASSLTSSFPVIENYYSLASSLADLHDELVIIKDGFNDQALYSLPTTAGESRVLRFTLYYITKDGRLHKLFIPKKGIFALQLTFGITYYYTS
jgi:hypothetical protein